jgi:hypothetical protein
LDLREYNYCNFNDSIGFTITLFIVENMEKSKE